MLGLEWSTYSPNYATSFNSSLSQPQNTTWKNLKEERSQELFAWIIHLESSVPNQHNGTSGTMAPLSMHYLSPLKVPGLLIQDLLIMDRKHPFISLKFFNFFRHQGICYIKSCGHIVLINYIDRIISGDLKSSQGPTKSKILFYTCTLPIWHFHNSYKMVFQHHTVNALPYKK